jgi:regulator of protease activity HflC (stomatin/prohibitin superfamily)
MSGTTREQEMRSPVNGWIGLFIVLLLLALGLGAIFTARPFIGMFLLILGLFLSKGLTVLQPNESAVLVFFGNYASTLRRDGFFWVNPFYLKKRISLRVQNFVTPTLKVNDKLGNPIDIGAVVTWRVHDTARAVFDVEHYESYIHAQSDMGLREVAGSHAYDAATDDVGLTLRGNFQAISQLLTETLQDHVDVAGVVILEAKISHLAYAAEIAGVMLRRQQAEAVVQAREKMVEGAIGMVKMALDRMESQRIAQFTPDQKAALVTSMMTVLLSETGAQPVVHTGQS